MTNYERLQQSDEEREPCDIVAVKMLLGIMFDDYDRGLFRHNYKHYLPLYKHMKEWLEREE